MRIVWAALLASLFCGSAWPDEVADTDNVDPSLAYVVLAPSIFVAKETMRQVDLSLVCVDFGNKDRRTHFYPKLDNFKVTVVAIPPGVCALDGIRMGSLHSRVPPSVTAFRAEAGRLNYPGDWPVRYHVNGYIEVPGVSNVGVEMSGNVVRSAQTEAAVPRLFPRLSSRMPLQYTKLAD